MFLRKFKGPVKVFGANSSWAPEKSYPWISWLYCFLYSHLFFAGHCLQGCQQRVGALLQTQFPLSVCQQYHATLVSFQARTIQEIAPEHFWEHIGSQLILEPQRIIWPPGTRVGFLQLLPVYTSLWTPILAGKQTHISVACWFLTHWEPDWQNYPYGFLLYCIYFGSHNDWVPNS